MLRALVLGQPTVGKTAGRVDPDLERPRQRQAPGREAGHRGQQGRQRRDRIHCAAPHGRPEQNQRGGMCERLRNPADAPLPSGRRQGRPWDEHSDALEDQRAVGAAEPERVLQRDVDAHLARGIRAVIEIALGVLIEDVDGRG